MVSNKSHVDKEHAETLNQLHLAEYQALSNRVAYWEVLQFSLAPIVPVYLGVAAVIFTSGKITGDKTKLTIAVWATLAGLELLGVLWAQIMVEQFTIIRYIELYLRHLIKNVSSDNIFWGYEPHLVKHRAGQLKAGAYWSPALLVTLIVITVVIQWRGFSKLDAICLVLNLLIFSFMIWFVITSQMMLNEWTEGNKELGEKLDAFLAMD